MNGKSVTQTKHGQLEVTYPPSDQDLMDTLADLNLCKQRYKNGEGDPTSNDEQGGFSHVGKEKEKGNDSTENAGKGMCWQSQTNTNKTSRITHNNQNTLDCSR